MEVVLIKDYQGLGKAMDVLQVKTVMPATILFRKESLSLQLKETKESC